MKKLFYFNLLFIHNTPNQTAQSNTPGHLRGVIRDQKSGEILIGTTVQALNTSVGTVTDLDGKYDLTLPPGTYTIQISLVGYTPQKIENVNIRSGLGTELDILLEEFVQEISEVVISANRINKTENSLLALQKRSIMIQDGVTSQELSRSSNNNAAESMKRVTGASVVDGKYVYVRGLGDRYSSAQLNGLPLPGADPYRNSASLDLIPTLSLIHI